MKIKLIIAFLAVGLLGSIVSVAQNPTQNVLLFKDKDGLYLYSTSAGTEKLLFKTNADQVFLDGSSKITNDVLTFGITPSSITQTMTNYAMKETYYKDYFSVDLKTGKSWQSGKIAYTFDGDKLRIRTLAVSPKGDTTVLQDSSSTWNQPAKGNPYNTIKSRFYPQNKTGDKSAISKKGNIYYADKKDTTLMVKYTSLYDPKLICGYTEPQLAPTGDYIIFRYIPHTSHVEEKQSLQKVDIKTKKVTIIKEGQYANTRFSKDGKFIVFTRHESDNGKLTRVYNAYILNLTTMQEKKIGKAKLAEWVQ